MDYKYMAIRGGKLALKWLVMMPIALLWDGITFFFTKGAEMCKYVNDTFTENFNNIVNWCDKK